MIFGGVFGLFSFQSFFFVGEVSVILLLMSKRGLLSLYPANVIRRYLRRTTFVPSKFVSINFEGTGWVAQLWR